jgi:uncharacterized protein (DUF2062 family)
MPRKLLQRYLPDQDTISRYEITKRFTPFLKRPELWAIKRHLIAGGLAVGLFCGMIPGPLQMLAALSLAIALRVNLPVAVVGTFFTNPLTILPLYLLAYMIGQWCIGDTGASTMPAFPITDWSQPGLALSTWSDWILGFGQPLVLGLFILACLLGIAGYALVQVSWRINVLHALRQRRYNRTKLHRSSSYPASADD